jgi:hypothetical protein
MVPLEYSAGGWFKTVYENFWVDLFCLTSNSKDRTLCSYLIKNKVAVSSYTLLNCAQFTGGNSNIVFNNVVVVPGWYYIFGSYNHQTL